MNDKNPNGAVAGSAVERNLSEFTHFKNEISQ
jgi:hypothetical protein